MATDTLIPPMTVRVEDHTGDTVQHSSFEITDQQFLAEHARLREALTPRFRMSSRSTSWYAQDGDSWETATHAIMFFNRKQRGEMRKDPVTGEWNGWFRWSGKDFISVDIQTTDGYETANEVGRQLDRKFRQQVERAGGVFP